MTQFLEAIQYSFYQDRIDPNQFNWLVSLDPTKTKKYARWIVEVYLKSLNEEKVYLQNKSNVLSTMLKSYDNYKNKQVIPPKYTNILIFKTFGSFIDFMHENIEAYQQMVDEKAPDRDVEILYRDKHTILVIPKSHEASRKWGGNSNWCTATSNCTYYDRYTKDGTLYIHRFFDETGKMIKDKGYQLYIPKSDDVEMNHVECRDMHDDTITDMHLFYDGLPKDIVQSLESDIDDFGGLNAFEEIQGSIYGEVEDDHVKIFAAYELVRITDSDVDTIDQGDETTGSSVEVYAIGKKETNEVTEPLQTLVEFDINKGKGIYVLYISEVTLERAYENATNRWHQAGRPDTVDTYEAERALRDLLGKDEKYDYIIVHGYMDLDDDMQNLLNDHFDFYSEWKEPGGRHKIYETIADEDSEGNPYTIYFQIGFDYTRRDEGARASTAMQRTYDKQMDLPYGL